MTDPAARYEVKVSPVLSAGVYKDSSGNYYELVITYTPSDDDPTICEKFVLPAGTNFSQMRVCETMWTKMKTSQTC